MKAIRNDTILAESDDTKVVEGNHYFPPQSVNDKHLEESDTEYTCPWKGEAEHYDVVVGEQRSEDAAWSYPEPKQAAREIKDRVAFYSDRVQVAE